MKLSYPVDIGFYESDASGLAHNECLNLYPSNPQTIGASSRGGLFSLPGSEIFATGDFSTSIGKHLFKGELYIVSSNNNVVKVDSSGVVTVVGAVSITTGTNDVSIADNGEVMCIVIAGATNKSYFFDEVNGVVQITDSVFQDREAEGDGIGGVDFIDGYFAFCTNESLFISSLVTTNQGKNFAALDLVKPFLNEKALVPKEIKGELYVFGENQIKVYSDVGGADFPFVEIPGATIDKGIEQRSGVVVFDNSFFFVGGGVNERVSVWRGVGGGGAVKISTDSIDTIWDGPATGRHLGNGFMFQGRPFVGFDINSRVFFYDIQSSSTQGRHVWIEWANTSTGFSEGGIIEAYSRIMYLGQGVVQELTKARTYFGEFNLPRTCRFSGAYLNAQSDSLIVNRLELVVETGVGFDIEINPSQADPMILMEYSDDQARTWKNAGERALGRQGDFTRRLVWTRMNRTPTSRIFRFSTTTDVPVRFIRIDIEAQKGFRHG